MANTYKDIVITPFRGDANNVPVIRFSSGDASVNSDMNVRFYAASNGTLSFEGNSGQMFSITNDMTGTIFSVNDISGIPSIEVNASGQIAMAHFGGNVGIGTANAIYKLDVAGDARITGNVILGDASTDTITINGSTISLGNNQNIDAGTLFIDAVNNEVGVGTTNPTSNLHVIGTANITSSAVIGGSLSLTNFSSDRKILFSRTSAARSFSIEHDNSRLYFWNVTNGAPILSMSNDNRVGINTVDPTSNLHVIGTANITTSLTVADVNIVPAITASFLKANQVGEAVTTANGNITAAFLKANQVGEAVTTANARIDISHNTANLAFNTANLGFNKANAALPSTGGTITGDVSVVGNLTVSGNTSYISVTNFRVDDALIYLAGNNYVSDIVDIGFIGNYVNSTGQNVHTGLFRDHGTKEYYLFSGYDQEPINNHIDPNGNNFTVSILNTAVRTSNLILGGINAIPWITSAFTTANAAFLKANQVGEAVTTANTNITNLGGALTTANSNITAAFLKANQVGEAVTTANSNITAAFLKANQVGEAVTTANTNINNLGGAISTANSNITAAFLKANQVGEAVTTANTNTKNAYDTANAAFNKANSSGGVSVSDAAPGSPTANSLWWSSNVGKLFIYYNDGTSSQWVETSPAPDTSGAYNTANLAFNRANAATNVAINLDTVNAERFVTFEDTLTGIATTVNVSTGFKFTPSSNTLNVAGVIRDSKGDVRDLPVFTQAAGYGLSLNDTGEVISTSATVFVPNTVFFAGNAVSIFNNSAASITITQNSSVTMYLGGTATTGNRTLAQRGVATILCVAANTFVISGAGLT